MRQRRQKWLRISGDFLRRRDPHQVRRILTPRGRFSVRRSADSPVAESIDPGQIKSSVLLSLGWAENFGEDQGVAGGIGAGEKLADPEFPSMG